MIIENTKNQKLTGISAFVYAGTGVGKTTGAGMLPGKTLIIDLEGGASVLRNKEIDMIKINRDLSNLREVFEEIPNLKYDNIVFDSITKLESAMLTNYAEKSKIEVPQLQDYNKMIFKLQAYMKKLQVIQDTGKNVLITALEEYYQIEVGEGIVKTILQPMVNARKGKLIQKILGDFDIIGHLEISEKEGKEGQRYIRLTPSEKLVAKDRIFGRKFTKFENLFNGKEL